MSMKYYKQVANMSIQEMVALLNREVTTQADKTRQCYACGFLMHIANYIDYGHYDKIKNVVESIRNEGK